MAQAEAGQQLELIEVGPENLKEIEPHLEKYKAALKQRQAALKIEVEQKKIILDLVKRAKLKPLANGRIKFQCRGIEIELEPTDVVIHIREIKPKKKRGRPPKVSEADAGESKPDQGEPTEKEKKRKKRTAKSMQETVTATEAGGQ